MGMTLYNSNIQDYYKLIGYNEKIRVTEKKNMVVCNFFSGLFNNRFDRLFKEYKG